VCIGLSCLAERVLEFAITMRKLLSVCVSKVRDLTELIVLLLFALYWLVLIQYLPHTDQL